MTGITQSFGPVVALDAVDLTVEQGRIHAVVGENGAGKTTLMRILFGALQPTAGVVEIDGNAVRFASAADGIKAGVGMVSQHYSIIPELTCLQNLMLGAEPGVWIDSESAASRAETLAKRMGFAFDWHATASNLSPASAQKLEILKLLWRDSQVMILDEPTAMLSPADSDLLYASLRSLAESGATIIVVTHRLPEVMEHAQTVTVLRGGKLVADSPVSETTTETLANWIVGHELAPATKSVPCLGSVRLEVRDLTVRGDRGHDAVRRASLRLHAGEVVGVAGVDGNGQRELFHAIVGRTSPTAGRVILDETDVTSADPSTRIRQGLRLIPEDRLAEAVIEPWSLSDNAALGLQRLPPLARGVWTVPSERASLAERVAARFQTKFATLSQPIGSLSGGNQQRFVAGRALALEPGVLLAFQPTRGLDIHGTDQVYQALRDHARAGGAALVVSFDLDELLDQCDRIIVINGGKVMEPETELAHDRAEIGRLMVASP